MGNSPPKPSNDRVFVMIGKVANGKSTLGNFLIGGSYDSFKTSDERHSFSTTRYVQTTETTLSPETVARMGFVENNAEINIKVIDQPGMDDAEIDVANHCGNLVKCLENLDVKTFATFLILVNLELSRLSDDRCLLLTQLSELLSQASYGLFPHAIIVFTHADKVVGDVNNRAELIQLVRIKIEQNVQGWEQLGEIFQAVNERCIFVNGTSRDVNYRSQILKELFELSKSTLTLRFHGNTDFTSRDLQGKLGARGDRIVQKEFYNFDYQFHQDLNIFWQDECKGDLENQTNRAIETMICVEEGVSAMVVLISLVDPFSTQMEELVLKLPGYYIPKELTSKSLVEKWWKQTFIVFRVPFENNAQTFVQTNIEKNPRIKSLVGKVSDRWTWVAEDTIARTCKDRMTEMCLAVRKNVAGRDFIQNTVIKEIREKMKETKDLQGAPTEAKVFTQEFHNLMARGGLVIMESRNSVFVKLGGIPFKHKISVRSIRLILKNTLLSEEQIRRFKEQYPDAQAKVSIDEVLHFLAQLKPWRC